MPPYPLADVDLAARVLQQFIAAVLAADTTGESVEEIVDLHVLSDLARLALTPDVVAQAERDAASIITSMES